MAAVIENTVHPAFEKLRSHRISTLNVTVEEYRHRKTGARHLHLAADNDENVFFVALRTFPMDSTGVAHILEHTALCGSERFPVRDPFFMMIRRSLNTFMNAFTSSDWTAYPFASMNRKDFDNLLTVYLSSFLASKQNDTSSPHISCTFPLSNTCIFGANQGYSSLSKTPFLINTQPKPV